MFDLTDRILLNYFKWRHTRIEKVMLNPSMYQNAILKRILDTNKHTEFGRKHDFAKLNDIGDYRSSVQAREYEAFYPYIEKMMHGQENILCSEAIDWFAKSSGTSTGRSKYIPVSHNYLLRGHLKCAWDAASMIYNEDPEARLFAEKSLIMGGSTETLSSGKKAGDISGIIIKHFPKIGKRFYTPDFETALMKDWDEKIKNMARITSRQNLTLIAGVPTWLIVLFKEILEQTGASNISEVWPNLRSFLHGGVNFDPYREQFRKYIPSSDLVYREVYNASEGYFAIQDKSGEDGMLLLCDHEIYYEFIPWNGEAEDSENALSIDEIEIGQVYSLCISNSSGLYRYKIGDLVEVVSIAPVKIKIAGRTKSMLNVFGEELSVANAECAISEICLRHKAMISDYTVAPVFLEQREKGRHQWLVEFLDSPTDIEGFARDLDERLRALNSDYDAKRSQDLALTNLELIVLPKGSFEEWQRKTGRYGGQNKIPRLKNDRQMAEEILNLVMSDYK